jgi:predicted Zn-dependent peptidase
LVTRGLYEGAYEAKLENGLRILVEEVPQSRSVSVGIWVRAGSRDDPHDALGIAHFIEHLAFKGTTRRDAGAISREIDAVGGHLNAATGKESTFYYADVPAAGLSTAVDVLADLVLHPRFDADQIELERNVVLEEIRGHLDDPEQSAYDLFAAGLWDDGHPLSRSVLGTQEAIAGATRSTVASHHAQYYRPENTVLVACGAVKARDLVDQANGLFMSGEAPKDATERRSAAILHPGRRHHERPTGQTHVYFGLAGPRSSDDDRFPLEVVNSVLGDGPSSRLFRSVREDRGLAYAVASSVTCYADCGLWLIYAGVAPKTVSQVIGLVSAEFERLRTEPIPEDELELAKSKLRGHLILGLETNGNRAVRLATAAMHRRKILSPDDLLARLDRVDQEETQRVIARYLRPDVVSLTTVGPAA